MPLILSAINTIPNSTTPPPSPPCNNKLATNKPKPNNKSTNLKTASVKNKPKPPPPSPKPTGIKKNPPFIGNEAVKLDLLGSNGVAIKKADYLAVKLNGQLSPTLTIIGLSGIPTPNKRPPSENTPPNSLKESKPTPSTKTPPPPSSTNGIKPTPSPMKPPSAKANLSTSCNNWKQKENSAKTKSPK